MVDSSGVSTNLLSIGSISFKTPGNLIKPSASTGMTATGGDLFLEAPNLTIATGEFLNF